jgi:hypothetical protein
MDSSVSPTADRLISNKFADLIWLKKILQIHIVKSKKILGTQTRCHIDFTTASHADMRLKSAAVRGIPVHGRMLSSTRSESPSNRVS